MTDADLRPRPAGWRTGSSPESDDRARAIMTACRALAGNVITVGEAEVLARQFLRALGLSAVG